MDKPIYMAVIECEVKRPQTVNRPRTVAEESRPDTAALNVLNTVTL